MKLHRRIAPFVTIPLITMVALVASCSNKATNPINNPPALNSGDIAANGQFPHTFASAGTFNYRCTRHSGMTGSVTVVNGAPMAASVSITDNVFTPGTASVAPGGTVTWTNNGSALHTVTSI